MSLDQKAVMARWCPLYKPTSGAVLRVFCFPYSGGGAAIFRLWQSKLPSFVEVCPIELAGRGVRWKETPSSCLTPLVESIASVIIGLLNKPFVFFGHSMGGLICYELTHYLRKNYKLQPAQLVVSGCRAPHFIEDREQTYKLPDAEFIEKMRKLNGTPPEILSNSELMQLFLPTLRADFAVVETYHYSPSPLLTCPITALGSTDDPEVSMAHILAWQEYTAGTFFHHIFPGDHFFINSSQDQVLSLLNKILARVVR